MPRIALVLALSAAAVVTVPPSVHAEDVAPSAAWGRHVAIIGGCNDCHTAGYAESNGKLDPAAALAGSPVGFRGPWGTTYPANLRLVAAKMDEAAFVDRMKHLETWPPMPFFNVREMGEGDLASLYLYIRSLGKPGDPAPDYVAPDREPVTPYIVFAPPTMPKG